jgi:alpha,alpha-trehalase
MEMKKYFLSILFVGALLFGCQDTNPPSEVGKIVSQRYFPWRDLQPIFEDVQMAGIFPDSKTFVDCTPNSEPRELLSIYSEFKGQKDFDLEAFVLDNFTLPKSTPAIEEMDDSGFFSHLDNHWDNLVRDGQEPVPYSTLISLPYQYVVPGGRFREIYYWDSYFTMIGLGVSGRTDLIGSMLDNFAHEVETIGYIPNGNRTYFLGRSQPPFFGAMIYLFAQLTSKEEALKYLPALQKEYDFWMDGEESVTDIDPAFRRVVKAGSFKLNRYYDDVHEPRPESYREDVELAETLSNEEKDQLYLDLRAACESGWDFSARWFAEGNDFTSIRTSQILPVDLNSILYHTEFVLSELYLTAGDDTSSQKYLKKAENRYQAINELFWNEKAQMYQDYLWTDKKHTGRITAASFYPMYFRVAQQNFAEKQTPLLIKELMDDGGILTSIYPSEQQWDEPNGWAPLQWVSYQGLRHYGFDEDAMDIKERWLEINQKVYAQSGKMMEKYNVSDTTLIAGGGEYPTQDGFGWTNGVALGLSVEDAKY